MTFLSHPCRNCGANLDVQPDNLLTICPFCGDVHPARDISDVPVHIVPSRTEQEVLEALHQRMAADKDMRGRQYTVQSAKGVYVPLYVNYVRVNGSWQGYETKRSNNSTTKVHKSGQIDHGGDFPVVARKHAYELGLAQLGPVVTSCQPTPFRTVDWKNASLPVLAVDIDETEVDAIVADDLIDLLGKRIRNANSLDAITHFDAVPQVTSRFILLYPLWTVIYLYEGGSYRVALEGGTPSVMVAMEPVFRGQRVKRFLATLGFTALAGVVWYIAWWVLLAADGDDAGEAVLALFVALAGCVLMAWRSAGKMLASVNVEGIEEAGAKDSLKNHPLLRKMLK